MQTRIQLLNYQYWQAKSKLIGILDMKLIVMEHGQNLKSYFNRIE